MSPNPSDRHPIDRFRPVSYTGPLVAALVAALVISVALAAGPAIAGMTADLTAADLTAGSMAEVTRFRDGADLMQPPYGANSSLYDGQFTGLCVGDYDRDGWQDVYITNHGNPITLPPLLSGQMPMGGEATNLHNPEGKGVANSLYRNQAAPNSSGAGGGRQLVEVGERLGVGDLPGIGGGCVFADFDNDGDLDLYVANHLRGVTFAEFGFHSVEQGMEINGFRDPEPLGMPNIFAYDSKEGQINGEFVVLTGPVTGAPRGEGRNTLFKNTLVETGTAGFVDITDQAGDVGGTATGLPGGRYSTTVAAADVNGDGLVDLYVGNFVDQDFWNTKGRVNVRGERGGAEGSHLRTNAQTNRLYLNRGGLRFEDATEEAGVGTVEVFYYDYDGSKNDPYEPELTDIRGNPVGERATLTWAVAFNDYDRDGDPDIWVANDSPGAVNLFRNDTEPGGRPRFTSVGRESGVDMIGEWMGFSFGDLDHDADLDVFAANFGGNIYTYTHNTNPELRVLADDVGEWNRWQNNASLHGLFRNDGVRTVRKEGLDQPVGIFPNIVQTVELEQSRWMPMVTADPTRVSPQKQPPQGMGPLEFAWGSLLFDYDNDTRVDLYTLGSLGKTMENPGRLLKNLGGYRFRDISVEAHALDILAVNYERVDLGLPPLPEDRIHWDLQAQHNENGGAVASLDLDGDGFLDMIALNTGGYDSGRPGVPSYPGSKMKAYRPGPALVFMNEGNGNHWLAVELTGAMTAADGPTPGLAARDAWGAFVVATIDTADGPLQLVRELSSNSGFQAQSSPVVHFGLGEATEVRRLEVHWPWNGGVTVLEGIAADQRIEIDQERGRVAAGDDEPADGEPADSAAGSARSGSAGGADQER